MKKIEGVAPRLRYFLARQGVTMRQEALIDAVAFIERWMAGGASFGQALWHWYAATLQNGVPLEPSICEHCTSPFLDWDYRQRKYCGEPCKQAAENRTWYRAHAAERVADVLRRRLPGRWKRHARALDLVPNTPAYRAEYYRWKKANDADTVREGARRNARRSAIRALLTERGIEADAEAILDLLPTGRAGRGSVERAVKLYIERLSHDPRLP